MRYIFDVLSFNLRVKYWRQNTRAIKIQMAVLSGMLAPAILVLRPIIPQLYVYANPRVYVRMLVVEACLPLRCEVCFKGRGGSGGGDAFPLWQREMRATFHRGKQRSGVGRSRGPRVYRALGVTGRLKPLCHSFSTLTNSITLAIMLVCISKPVATVIIIT